MAARTGNKDAGAAFGGRLVRARRTAADGLVVVNAKVEPRANGILITKQASGMAKIDALMATFNATDLMSLDPNTNQSIYTADRAPLILGV